MSPARRKGLTWVKVLRGSAWGAKLVHTERRVLFDLTDFDETLPGPWEFDVKRLATSLMLVA